MAVARANAVKDFRQARRRAGLEQLLSRITGKSPELLAFEDVRRQLRGGSMVPRGLQDIPLDAIVGSVGRYRDFTRSFLPLTDEDASRWADVKVAQETTGVPPIEVYQVGEVYFVLDGNHRVSVARQMGSKTIEAYVTEVQTKVALEPDVQPDDLIMKAEYADFLAQTQLDRLRPAGDLSLTAPGKYPLLHEHIEVHRYYLGMEQQREIPYDEAVTSWYDNVYLPTAELIARSGLLREFPQRTTADLYLWLTEHRARIEHALGMKVKPTKAAADLKVQSGDSAAGFSLARALKGGDAVEEVPQTKQQVARLAESPHAHLFETILVPFVRWETSWAALDQAFTIAQRESGHIRALLGIESKAEAESLLVREFEVAFQRRCRAAGVSGSLMLEARSLRDAVADLASLVDLTILTAPGGEPRDSGLRRLIRDVPGPTLLLPGRATAMKRVLLTFDGGWASQAVLAAGGYIARCWQAHLTVKLLADKPGVADELRAHAEGYLGSYGVTADVSAAGGKQKQATLRALREHECDLILWGGSGKAAQELLSTPLDNEGKQQLELPLLLCN